MGRRDRERRERIQQGLELSRAQKAAVMNQVEEPQMVFLRNVTRQTARKSYLCEGVRDQGPCGRLIEPGQEYVRLVTIDPAANKGKGKYGSVKLCSDCDSHGVAHEQPKT
jgi:hypothetical protein